MTQAGLDRRADQWGQYSAYKLYNKLVTETAKSYGAKYLLYLTMEIPSVCRLCWPFNRRLYSMGSFKPVIPRHHGCRCWYEIIYDRPPAGLV